MAEEFRSPNGYFQLWNMVLIEHEFNYTQLEWIAPYAAQSQHVAVFPIDSQSPEFFFFNSIMQLTQRQHGLPAIRS